VGYYIKDGIGEWQSVLKNIKVNQMQWTLDKCRFKIRDTLYQECKERINALVHEHKSGITTMEIAERLNVGRPELILKILSELKEEGKIKRI